MAKVMVVELASVVEPVAWSKRSRRASRGRRWGAGEQEVVSVEELAELEGSDHSGELGGDTGSDRKFAAPPYLMQIEGRGAPPPAQGCLRHRRPPINPTCQHEAAHSLKQRHAGWAAQLEMAMGTIIDSPR